MEREGGSIINPKGRGNEEMSGKGKWINSWKWGKGGRFEGRGGMNKFKGGGYVNNNNNNNKNYSLNLYNNNKNNETIIIIIMI